MWRDNSERSNSPVVVGGLGGSGTRVIAQIMFELDYYLGSYLNSQLDNLWFTFLMRRPASMRSFNSGEIHKSIKLFDSVMKSYWGKSFKARTQLYGLAAEFMLNNYVKRSRYKFPLNAARSIAHHHYHSEHQLWGWKEPNSHLFIDALHQYYPSMKFILVLRHPLDMMYGHNYNQLYHWHFLFGLPKPNKKNEKELMLNFYDAAYSRSISLGKNLLKENFMVIKIEELCASQEVLHHLIHFLVSDIDEEQIRSLKTIPTAQSTFGRYKNVPDIVKIKEAESICKKFNYKYT